MRVGHTPGAFNLVWLVPVLPFASSMVIFAMGRLIHVYAIGYMDGDPRYDRFFAQLNLFVFFMLLLVLADNFALLYVGWEGVGLCSYLLIGHWHERPAAANAAKKAFIVTRIGDAAFLVGIALIFTTFGSLDFSTVLRQQPVGGWTLYAPLSFPSPPGHTIIPFLLSPRA